MYTFLIVFAVVASSVALLGAAVAIQVAREARRGAQWRTSPAVARSLALDTLTSSDADGGRPMPPWHMGRYREVKRGVRIGDACQN